MGQMGTGRFVDLIEEKKKGKCLDADAIRAMINAYTAGKIPDYQMSSMLMAIWFQGMNDEELTAMTLAMRDSGEVVDLSAISGIKVDKHSTGGVGDKTTLIVGPVVAACGIPVAKMSGRGLGFTGGTLDKLESIPGFRVQLSDHEFFENVRECGISVIGQTADLAPADKLLYALRDVTATVDSIPLIAASIMSKKLAAGADKIVLDVTTGSGAFIPELDGSRELARRMTAIGKGAGRETAALITSMAEPLGYAVGNNLEVKEAIEVLHGRGPEDVREVCLALAGEMIALGREISEEEGKALAAEALDSGAAWERFLQMVQRQGGDISFVEHPEKFEMAPVQAEFCAGESGYIGSMDTAEIGRCAGILGAGRETKESVIDMSAGIMMKKKIGDPVQAGDVIAVLYTADQEKADRVLPYLEKAVEITDHPVEKPALVVERITADHN